ncbi:hypothetical protein ABZ354_24930 [Streptomyces sp. NPDC005925]|uniref:hypothetical protein n=1 Tax=Streptomyces sp. NPDC005925 TaxID=3157172 RepID=UPI0034092E84
MSDDTAHRPPDGHRGKELTVGAHSARVASNTATSLALTPWRPGADTARPGGTPAPGCAYEVPGSPAPRAGLTVRAAVTGASLDGDHLWDGQSPRTQELAVWIGGDGSWTGGRVTGDGFRGNARAALRFDTAPEGCHRRDNDE